MRSYSNVCSEADVSQLIQASKDVSVGCLAVDTSPDLGGGGQNILETFEMAIRHNGPTTRTELDSFFSVTGSIFTYVQKYFSGPLIGGGGRAITPSPPMDPPLVIEYLLNNT